jgi:hypothetical protein
MAALYFGFRPPMAHSGRFDFDAQLLASASGRAHFFIPLGSTEFSMRGLSRSRPVKIAH